MIEMRRSRVLKKLRAGEVVSCFKVNGEDIVAVEIAALSGFDCIWLCMEHIPNDWATIKAQILAAKVHDVDTIVRVPRGSYSDYIKPLEADATGIMVPHLMSEADVRTVVRQVRFHPEGRRPIDGGNQDGAYCMLPLPEYVQQANRERLVCIQIEDPEPMRELAAIAKVPGIDMLFFGPGDFSHGIGSVGDWNAPALLEARKKIPEAARAHGKFAGVPAAPEQIEEMVALGYRFLALGSDVGAVGRYCGDVIGEFRKRTGAQRGCKA
ncbi:MAG: aldolase/citrate lyase family protein [Planctomycetota bacterium]